MAARRILRRIARVATITVSVIVGLVLLIVILLQVRPLRENALEAMVRIASDSLPGTLSVRESSWPALSRIELGGVVWEDQVARLVVAERVAVDIDLGALRHKDVHARTIILETLEVDLPGILAAFPADESADGNPPDFPRAGSMPWAPSISLDSLVVDARSLVLDDSTTLSLAVALGLELRSGRPARLEVEHLVAGWIERGWELQSGGMQVSMASGEFSGGFDAILGERGSIRLDLETDDDREFGLRLVDAAHPDPPLLEASGSFTQRDDGLVTSVEYVASLTSPELARIEELTRRPGSLAQLEPLGAVGLEARGHVDLSGPVRGEVRLSASSRPASVAALLRHEGSAVTVDSMWVTGEGLALDAEGTWENGAWTALVRATVDRLEFLEGFAEIDRLPADLRARLDLSASGSGTRINPTLVLSGAAPSSGLDSLVVEVGGRADGADTDLRARIRALARVGVALGIDAQLLDLNAPRIHLAPVRLDSQMVRLDPPPGYPSRPTLRIDRAARAITVDALRLSGILGELRLDGQVAEETGGSGRLEIVWPTPPDALGLAGFDATARDSLLAPTWSADGTPSILANFDLPAGLRSGEVVASISLPAPWKVVAGLDPEVYTAGNLRGSLEGRWSDDGSWRALLDFAETAWLDSAFVHAGALDGVTRLDSMLVRGGPVRMTAAGSLDSTEVDGKFQLDLVPHPALALLVPGLPADLQFLVNLRAGVAGSLQAPDARARVLATARSDVLSLPLAVVEAELAEGIVQFARVEIPERASIGEFALDRGAIEIRPESPAESLFPLWVATDLHGDATWQQLARVDSLGGTWTVRSDSLEIGAAGNGMRSQHPFEVRFAPADSVLQIEGLDLAGNAGTISASLDLAPDRARADVDIHLNNSIPSALVQMPRQMLPTGYHVVAKGSESDLEASVWIEGINLGTRRGIVARVDSRREGEQVAVQVRATDELGVLADGGFTLPLTIDLLKRNFRWYDGPLTGQVTVDSLPLPYQIGGNQGLSRYLVGARDATAPLLDARLMLGGTGAQPVAGARIGVGFPEVKELREHRLGLDAIWIGPSADPATLGLFEDPEILQTLRSALPHGGIAARGSLNHGAIPLATLRAGFPLAPDARSSIPGFGRDDRVLFSLSAQPMRLAEWNSMLPPGTTVGGELWIDAHGEGPIGDLPLEAKIRMKELRYQASFSGAATLDGSIDISGTSAAPVIHGRIRVPSALVRLPESGPELHPMNGEAQLWSLGLEPESEFAALDSLEVDWGWAFSAADTADTDVPAEPVLTLAEATELDVKIEIPNSFWIRGQGLEVQLSGDLHIGLRDGVPVVLGELKALSGQLEVVGARLKLDRGLVTFYGGDTTNPSLDLELSRSQGDVKVIVRVTGTALEPRLAFDSDPPMSQSDIMSYLLFGNSASDLDGAQTQLLQDQAAAALSQFAAPMLENELTQSLGITMMQLQAGDDPEDGLSLVVGKYVTPQILIKYEQSLKDRQKYTVNAEYWLSRQFRIETQLSESQSTGIQLNWSTDY